MSDNFQARPRRANPISRPCLAKVVPTFVLIVITGCPAATPGERVKQLGGVITPVGDGVIDLDLSASPVTDSDMPYIFGLCSNDPNLKSIRKLDLSDTDITDQALEYMARQIVNVASSEQVQILVVTDTEVTAAAIEDFRATAPDCQVQR